MKQFRKMNPQQYPQQPQYQQPQQYPQQQQQYQPQQPRQPWQTMQNMYQQYQPQAPPGAHKHTLLVSMVILLVIIFVSLIFVYVNIDGEPKPVQYREEPSTPYLGEPPAEEIFPEFKITNFKFASIVDDNLNYQEIPATFNRGDKFWIYFEINNLESGDLRGKYRTRKLEKSTLSQRQKQWTSFIKNLRLCLND